MNLLASDFIINIGVFRILPNIFDGEFCLPQKKIKYLKLLNIFAKRLMTKNTKLSVKLICKSSIIISRLQRKSYCSKIVWEWNRLLWGESKSFFKAIASLYESESIIFHLILKPITLTSNLSKKEECEYIHCKSDQRCSKITRDNCIKMSKWRSSMWYRSHKSHSKHSLNYYHFRDKIRFSRQ